MRKTGIIITLAISVMACGGKKEANRPVMKTDRERASYAFGISQAQQVVTRMQQGSLDSLLDMKLFMEGFKDYVEKKARLNPEEVQTALKTYGDQIMEEKRKEFEKKYSGKKTEGEKYLAENRQREGVTTTESGLQYEIIAPGKGPKVLMGDSVSVGYTGKLVDGTVFDSSDDHGPYNFRVMFNAAIAGWIEGLQLMQSGGKYRLYVPWDLAYGEQGSPPVIPPYSVLIFDMEIKAHVPAKH